MFRERWRCPECGAGYRRRPAACDCGCVVLDPVGVDADAPPVRQRAERPSRPASDGDGATKPTWTCERCGREHDTEPVTCAACGGAAFDYDGPPRDAGDHALPPGFPSSPEAFARDVRESDHDPVPLRGVLLVVLVCLAFLVALYVLFP